MAPDFAPAAFLDRDGVVNRDFGYVDSPARFQFLPGVKGACRRLVAAGYRLVIVTNQGGIALGRYGEADFQSINRHMLAVFAAANVAVAAVYWCPYHPRAPHRYRQWRAWRKPAPGMLLAAAKAHRLDLSRSFMVGDKKSDMQAAAAAGVERRYLLADSPMPGVILCRSLARATAMQLRVLESENVGAFR